MAPLLPDFIWATSPPFPDFAALHPGYSHYRFFFFFFP
jgi:hypothetical protein